MPENWPITLRDREIALRPLRRGDRRAYEALRTRNRAWLAPWEATDPDPRRGRPPFRTMLRWSDRAAREGTMLPFAVTVQGRLAGQVTVGPIQYGPASGAVIGYWIDEALAGRGLTSRAVALAIDHCFAGLHLHRVELLIRPENLASRRLARRLHLREEGLRRSCIHVDGAWRDHVVHALTAEEVRGTDPEGRGVLERLHRERSRPGPPTRGAEPSADSSPARPGAS